MESWEFSFAPGASIQRRQIMEYRIKVKCTKLNPKAFIQLEQKFRAMLEDLAMSEGAESMVVTGVKLHMIEELEGAFQLAEHIDLILEKKANEKNHDED